MLKELDLQDKINYLHELRFGGFMDITNLREIALIIDKIRVFEDTKNYTKHTQTGYKITPDYLCEKAETVDRFPYVVADTGNVYKLDGDEYVKLGYHRHFTRDQLNLMIAGKDPLLTKEQEEMVEFYSAIRVKEIFK